MIKRFTMAIAAAAMALSMGGCAQVRDWFGLEGEASNPLEVAESVDVKVLAAYGIVTIALEEAATVAENPATPDSVVLAIARAAPAVKGAADTARTAALEYRRARVAYEAARDAGLDNQAALLTAATQAGMRVTSTVAELRQALERMKSAFVRGNADTTTVEDAETLLAGT